MHAVEIEVSQRKQQLRRGNDSCLLQVSCHSDGVHLKFGCSASIVLWLCRAIVQVLVLARRGVAKCVMRAVNHSVLSIDDACALPPGFETSRVQHSSPLQVDRVHPHQGGVGATGKSPSNAKTVV